jgi:CcmD family protein
MRPLHIYVIALVALFAVPGLVEAQTGASSPFRHYLFVILAFAAAWLLIAMWAFQIGRKLMRLSKRIEDAGGRP